MIIGLTGKARAGKDTVADILCKNHDFVRVAFADPIKRMTQALLSMNPVVLEQMKDMRMQFLSGITPRRIMQTLGTEWGRELIMEDIWLRFAIEKIEVLQQMGVKNIVVTDVRFQNEAESLHALGAKIYEVRRKTKVPVEAHSSEEGINPELITGVIYNYGSHVAELVETLIDFPNLPE